MLTLQKKIPPPLLPGFELATFQPRVRRSLWLQHVQCQFLLWLLHVQFQFPLLMAVAWTVSISVGCCMYSFRFRYGCCMSCSLNFRCVCCVYRFSLFPQFSLWFLHVQLQFILIPQTAVAGTIFDSNYGPVACTIPIPVMAVACAVPIFLTAV